MCKLDVKISTQFIQYTSHAQYLQFLHYSAEFIAGFINNLLNWFCSAQEEPEEAGGALVGPLQTGGEHQVTPARQAGAEQPGAPGRRGRLRRIKVLAHNFTRS